MAFSVREIANLCPFTLATPLLQIAVTGGKQIFDALYGQRVTLRTKLGEEITWERLDDRRASRIVLYHPGSITDDESVLADLRSWAVDAMVRFYRAFAEPAGRALLAAD